MTQVKRAKGRGRPKMTPARRSTRVQDLQMKQEEELRERSITPELPELDELASIELPASVNAEEYAVINSSGTNADKNSLLPASVITQLSDSEDDATEVPDNQVAGKVEEATEDGENGVEGGSEQGEDEDEEMVDAEENEYEVEAIRKHEFHKVGGGDDVLMYLVKWKGYEKKSEQTWEPAENLATAQIILDEYHREIGGKPTQGKSHATRKSNGTPQSLAKASTSTIQEKYSTVSPDGRRRSGRGAGNGASSLKHSLSDEDEPAETAKRAGRPRRGPVPKHELEQADDQRMTVKTQKWEPPSGSWENLIMTIDTVEKDTKDGSLQVYLHWNDGRKSKHSAPTCYKKAPQKMLHFYEMHLVFKEGTRKPAPVPGESPPGVGGKKGEYEELLSGGPGGVDPVADSAELETIDNVEEHPEVMEHTSDLSVEEGMSGIIGGPAPGANG